MGIRVLLIEDEASIADFVMPACREEGFVVAHAADGESGWHELQTATWDVVLLDWWLPGQDGLALLRRFRQRERATPVLFLTARDAVSDRVRSLDAGADDYLCKPFAFEELLARVRALARRRAGVGTGSELTGFFVSPQAILFAVVQRDRVAQHLPRVVRAHRLVHLDRLPLQGLVVHEEALHLAQPVRRQVAGSTGTRRMTGHRRGRR